MCSTWFFRIVDPKILISSTPYTPNLFSYVCIFPWHGIPKQDNLQGTLHINAICSNLYIPKMPQKQPIFLMHSKKLFVTIWHTWDTQPFTHILTLSPLACPLLQIIYKFMGQVDESAGFKIVFLPSFNPVSIILLAKNFFLVVYGILSIHNFVQVHHLSLYFIAKNV